MPFIFNFNKSLNEVNEVTISPKGWIENIVIEYCVAQAHNYDTLPSLCWRIKGTTHTFTIYEHVLKEPSKDNYAKHFKETLEIFREDYISWFEKEEYKDCEWKWEYKREYGHLIQ